MPQFSNVPPDPDRPKNWKLIRTPTKQPLKAIVLSEDIVGCPTHFWGGRTVPCETTDCPACADGSPTRWHGYLAIWLPVDNIRLLFEFPDGPAEILSQYRAANGSLRGCKIEASRNGPRPNARVILKTSRLDLTKYQLPDAPNVTKMLLQMWELPGKAFEAPPIGGGSKNVAATPAVLRRMRGQPPHKEDITDRMIRDADGPEHSIFDEAATRAIANGNGKGNHK